MTVPAFEFEPHPKAAPRVVVKSAQFALKSYQEWLVNENADEDEDLRYVFIEAAHDLMEDVLGPIERCRDCSRVTRIDDEPVDTDAADGQDGFCGSCADREYGKNGEH